MPRARGKERFLLRVQKGALVPVDGYTVERLREKGYRIGDILSATLAKPRNSGFHRLAHALGRLVADNIEDFTGVNSHKCLKRLQFESGIGCEEFGARVGGNGFVVVRIPQSLSYASMDDGEFREVMRGLCRWVSRTYWPGMTAEQIEEMAELMVNE